MSVQACMHVWVCTCVNYSLVLYNVQIRDNFPCMILAWTINSLVSHLTLLSSIEMSTGQWYVQLSLIWHWHLPLCIIYKFCMFKSSSRSVLDFCTFMFFYYLCPFLFSYYKKITLIIQPSWSRFDLRKGLTMGSLEMCICVLHDRVWSYRATLQGWQDVQM